MDIISTLKFWYFIVALTSIFLVIYKFSEYEIP